MTSVVRRAQLAGRWYPGTRNALLQAVEDSFKGPFGPGSLPSHHAKWKEDRGSLIGIISPHAGISASGQVAAHGYHAIGADGDGLPDTIVIIGSHGGFPGIYLQDAGAWTTPLGESQVDEELAAEIAREAPEIKVDNARMLQVTDNTFEMQLPFIQYLSIDIAIVPVAAGSRDPSLIKKAATGLARALAPHVSGSSGKKVVVVASTDLIHYGKAAYGFAPLDGRPIEEQHRWMKEHDKKLVDFILGIDENDPSIITSPARRGSHENYCCPGAINLALDTLKALKGSGAIKALRPRLLKYATSHDIDPSVNPFYGFLAVGYASIAFTADR